MMTGLLMLALALSHPKQALVFYRNGVEQLRIYRSDVGDVEHRRDLIVAMRSRLLTDAELYEVGCYGEYIFDPSSGWFVSGPEHNLTNSRKLNELYFQQFKFRIEAEKNRPRKSK